MTNASVPTGSDSSWLVGGWGPDMDGESHGISVMRSRSDGSLQLCQLAAVAPSPSFLVVDGDRVYASLEGAGSVAAYERNGEALTLIHTESSGGQYPCHLTVARTVIVAANYGSGTLGVLERNTETGALVLRSAADTEGSGPRPQQDGPHAHASLFVDDRTLFTVDLGADRIRIFDYSDHTLTPVDEVTVPHGFGPRDIVARANNIFFVLGELGLHFAVFEWRDRQLRQLCSIALPGAIEGDQGSAIAISADGRHAYVGVRGSNLISVLAIAEDGRSVAPLVAVPSAGNWPRHLVMHDDILHVCNQLSNDVASFRIDQNGIPRLIAPPTPVLSPTYLARIH